VFEIARYSSKATSEVDLGYRLLPILSVFGVELGLMQVVVISSCVQCLSWM
jgi:hypothetical protein